VHGGFRTTDMQHKTVSLREHQPRTGHLWKYAFAFILCGLTVGIFWLLVGIWKRVTTDFVLDSVSRTMAIQPMRLNPLIAGNDRAVGGETVYLTRVLLKPGPAPKIFFLAGSQGTQILTVAEGAHVVATPGNTVDVRGTIRNTPSAATLRKRWKLSPAEARLVSQVPIYIESDFIRQSGE
jgi:hypothetical protein